MKRIKKLWKTVGDFEVYLVDGATVRRNKEIDFSWGGHNGRFSCIPKKEIWIENEGTTQEKNFVLLHELHESRLMKDGMGYEKAHTETNKVELKARKNPKLLQSLLDIEISRIKNG